MRTIATLVADLYQLRVLVSEIRSRPIRGRWWRRRGKGAPLDLNTWRNRVFGPAAHALALGWATRYTGTSRHQELPLIPGAPTRTTWFGGTTSRSLPTTRPSGPKRGQTGVCNRLALAPSQVRSSHASRWPQRDSNPCCRRERAERGVERQFMRSCSGTTLLPEIPFCKRNLAITVRPGYTRY